MESETSFNLSRQNSSHKINYSLNYVNKMELIQSCKKLNNNNIINSNNL